jgi:hypothetical protein
MWLNGDLNLVHIIVMELNLNHFPDHAIYTCIPGFGGGDAGVTELDVAPQDDAVLLHC